MFFFDWLNRIAPQGKKGPPKTKEDNKERRVSYLRYKNPKTRFFATSNCKTKWHISWGPILKIHEEYTSKRYYISRSWSLISFPLESKLTKEPTIVIRRDFALAAHAMFKSPSWPLICCLKEKYREKKNAITMILKILVRKPKHRQSRGKETKACYNDRIQLLLPFLTVSNDKSG